MTPLNTISSGATRPVLLRSSLLGLTAGLISLPLHAQAVPDAGQLLQQQPKPPVAAPVQPAPVKPAEVTPETDSGPKILVKGFAIQGAVLIPASELNELLQPLVGRELSLRQIQAAASQLTAYYASRGYLARVIVPPQDIQDGIVILQVTEGKRGALDIQSTDPKLDRARIQRFIDNRMQAEAAFSLTALNTALTILNEQPGLAVKSSLKPGQQEGQIDLLINASAKPLVDINVGANNHGSRGTGEYQISGGLTLNNPSGEFDVLSLFINASEGNLLGRVDYGTALGDSGLRIGLNASAMRYRLVQNSFAALKGHGTAETFGSNLSYPLFRDTDFNLTFTASVDNKRLIDYTVVGETGNRLVAALTFGLNGYTLGERGVTSFGANLTSGASNQRNAGALASDQTSRQVQGKYAKLGYTFSHLLSFNADWSLNSALRGQFAGMNLDSSERMSLGGPTALRAYPVGEASGDNAWLVNLTLNRKLTDTLTGSLFADGGGVQQNRTLWNNWNASNPNLENSYQLAGAGIGFDWRLGNSTLLNASVAAPIGVNPGRDVNDLNSDGTPQHRIRGWISLNAQF